MNGRPPPTGGVASDSATIAAWTLASRVTGLGKIVAIAAVLGPTFLGNTFQAMNLVPNLAYEFLTGTLFANLLVPSLVRHVRLDDPVGMQRLAGRFMGLTMAAFAGLAAAIILAGPLILEVFTIGVADEAVAAAQRHAGWLLLALLVPQVVFYGIAGTAAAVLNATGRFGLVAAAPVVENLGLIATMAATAVIFGTGVTITEVTTAQLVLLGVGSTAAVVLHAAVLWSAARRRGVLLVPRRGWGDPELRDILGRALPSLGHAGLNSLRTFAVLVLANRVRGGVVAFQLALNFYHLPVALGAKSVSVAMLPRLSHLDQDGQATAFRDAFVRGTSLVLFLTVPAAVAYLVLAGPMGAAVAFGEMASPGASTLVAAALAGLAVGVLGEALFIVGIHGAYARQDARSPFRSMLVRTVVSLVGMAVATVVSEGAMLLFGLALAVTVGNLLSAGQLWGGVRRSLPVGGDRLGPDLAKTAAAALAMVVPAYLLATGLPRPFAGAAGALATLACGVVVGGGVFIGLQHAMGSRDLRAFLHTRGSPGDDPPHGPLVGPDASEGPERVMQEGDGRRVVAEPGGQTVVKSFVAGPTSGGKHLAHREFAHLQRFSEALADVPGVSCPRPLSQHDDPVPQVRMTRAPGIPLIDHLRHQRLSAETQDRLAAVLREALEVYLVTFGEPYYDFHFRNMVYHPATGELALLDFDIPLHFRGAPLQDFSDLEVSLGNLLGSCLVEAARPSRLLRLRQRRETTALCTAVLEAFASPGSGTTAQPPRLGAIRAVADVCFEGSIGYGSWRRRLWYRSGGRAMRALATRGMRLAVAKASSAGHTS